MIGGIDMVSQSVALAKKPHVIIGKYITTVPKSVPTKVENCSDLEGVDTG